MNVILSMNIVTKIVKFVRVAIIIFVWILIVMYDDNVFLMELLSK